MVNLSADNSSVAFYANKIANSTVTCNENEVKQLVVLEVQVNELAADVELQFTAVQVVIQGKKDLDLVDLFDLIDIQLPFTYCFRGNWNNCKSSFWTFKHGHESCKIQKNFWSDE